MKKEDITTLVIVGTISAVISLLISGRLFSIDEKSVQVPTVQSIEQTFPDVYNDSAYNNFLNPNALDLTIPVEIGDSQNKAPFSGN